MIYVTIFHRINILLLSYVNRQRMSQDVRCDQLLAGRSYGYCRTSQPEL